MKKSIIALLLAAVSVMSCEPPMPPSDEEMIRHFATHEAAFRKVYEIMSESSEGSFHYPPLSPEEVIILDPTEQSDTSHETNDEEDLPVYGLLKPDRIQLDSLLSEIGCGLVLVDRREWETADSVYVSLVMPYYSHGIVDAGTSKSFVYNSGLRAAGTSVSPNTATRTRTIAGRTTKPRCTSPSRKTGHRVRPFTIT